MSKSALYGANTSAQALSVNDVISFGSIVRRFGQNIGMSGGNAVMSGSGYYAIDTNFNFTAGATGVATIQLYKDGVAIVGANSTITVTSGDQYAITIPAIVRQICCCEATITAILTGVAGTISNASIAVEKL